MRPHDSKEICGDGHGPSALRHAAVRTLGEITREESPSQYLEQLFFGKRVRHRARGTRGRGRAAATAWARTSGQIAVAEIISRSTSRSTRRSAAARRTAATNRSA
jgi:hypothetical protein